MATFSDTFTRADGAIGADYETPPEDQISDQVDAIDFAIVSNGLTCANDPNINPHHLYGTARCLTAIPGDQQITLTVSNLDDCGFSGVIEIYAHMNGSDAACRVASWSTFDPPPASMYDYDSAGATSADFSNFVDPASSLASTTEFRLVSKTNGDWEIWTNGVLTDSGNEAGVAVGDYVGFGVRWNQSGADSSPRIEAFEAETLAADTSDSNVPEVRVEIAFDYGPFVATPTWVDVSDDVRFWSVNRGRSSELDSYQTGTAAVTLNNRLRTYDPNYSSGAYYGKLLPRKQIRIRATWASVTYFVFRGFIESWPQEYVYDGMDTTTTLSCVDAFSVLAGLPLNNSYYDLVVAAKTPIARWPLGSVGTIFPEVAGKLIGYLDGDLQALASEGATVADAPSPYMGPSTNFTGRSRLGTSAAPWASLSPLQEFSITGWFRTTALSPTSGSLRPIYSDGYYFDQRGVRVGIDSAGRLRYVGYDVTPTVYPEAFSNVNVVDGSWHHFAIEQSSGGTVTVYIDGVDSTVPVTSGQSDLMAPGAVVRLGMKTGVNPDSVFVGDLAEIAIFNYLLTATDVADLYNAGAAPLEGDTTGDQMTAVLDAVGWSVSLRDITDDGAECCPLAWSGETALSYAQKLDTTEQGAFFIASNGVVTFRNRYYTLQDTHGSVVQATFSDDGSDNPYNDLATDYGGAGTIINDVTVTTPGGGLAQRYTDATSVAANGPTAASLDTLAVSANAALNLAAFKVNRYKDPLTRATPFTVKPARSPAAMWPAVLGLELGYRIKLEKTPQRGGGKAGVGSQIVQELLVEQITHSSGGSPAAWTVTIGGSPGFISDDFWQLGVSQLGTSTTLGY